MEESSNQHVVQCKNRLCGKEYHESFSECPFCGTKNGEYVPPGGFVKQATRDFNAVAHIFLGLTMFATAVTIIGNFFEISNNNFFEEYYGLSNNNDVIVTEIVFDFMILIFAVLTFIKKRYGLIIFTLLLIIRVFATANTVYVYGYDMSAYVLGQKTAIFIRDFCPFAIAMCFRKNGISGWKSMLASEKYVKEHTKI